MIYNKIAIWISYETISQMYEKVSLMKQIVLEGKFTFDNSPFKKKLPHISQRFALRFE